MASKSQRRSKEDISPVSSPFASFLAEIQAGKVPQTEQLATAIEGLQGKLAQWRPAGESDPFAFVLDQLNAVLDGVKSLASKNLDENLNKIIEQGLALVEQGKSKAKAVQDVTKPEAKAIKDEATEILDSIKSLSAQLIYSSEFRTLLADCFDLTCDAGGLAAQKAKEAAIAGVDLAADTAKEITAESLSASSEEIKGKKRTRAASSRAASKKTRELTTIAPADRQRLRAKFDSIVKRANENEALRKGLESFMHISQLLRRAAKKGKRKAAAGAAEFDYTPIKNAWEETKKMLAKFGVSTESLETFSNDVWSFYTEVSNSKALSEAFEEIEVLFNDAIKNPSLLTSAAFGPRFENLSDRFRSAWSDLKEQEAFSRAYEFFSTFVRDLGANPALAVASKARAALGSTLFDEKGNFALKTEMMTKFRELFVKLFVAQLKSLQLPKLEGSNETYDWCFEEMTLNVADFLPDQLHLSFKNDMDIDVAKGVTSDRGKLILTAANIKPSLTNVKFWFRRNGIVSIEDQGIANIHVTGEGATITIRLDMDTTDYQLNKRLFRVTDVFCVIDNLKVMIVESEKHETLLSWLAPLVSSRVRSILEERIVNSLRDSIERIEEGMSTLVEIAPSLEQVREGVSLVTHPITQGVPAAVGLITSATKEGTTQG